MHSLITEFPIDLRNKYLSTLLNTDTQTNGVAKAQS